MKINQTIDDSGFNTTVVIRRKDLRPKNFALEGECGRLFHYLFLKKGEHYIMLKLCTNSPLILVFYYSVINWLCIN